MVGVEQRNLQTANSCFSDSFIISILSWGVWDAVRHPKLFYHYPLRYKNYHYLAVSMRTKITIATDSFKASLSSREAAEALAEGVRSVVPECEVVVVPVADGGEGTAEILTEALGGSWHTVATLDPLGRPFEARYGWHNGVAIMDVASAAGLTLLTPEERNPLLTSSLGVGRMILDAIDKGAHEIVLGVGGSATNDCAMGLLEGLGVRFFDSEGRRLRGCGANLGRVASIDLSGLCSELSERKIKITLVTDVTTPLCGPEGATRTFAPQKGASGSDVERLEKGVNNFAEVVRSTLGVDMTTLVGGGAAGGIAAGLWAFVGADIKSGVEEVLKAVGLERRAEGSALIITGEGRIDSQTLQGKLPIGVLAIANRMGIPTVAVGGRVLWCESLQSAGFKEIMEATPKDMPLREALKGEVARENLRSVGARIGRLLHSEVCKHR